MLSIADTGPLNYLVQISQVERLESVFGTILIPRAVWKELTHPRSREMVRVWANALPSWCRVIDLPEGDRADGRGAGEREAVRLFGLLEFEIDYVLVDDQGARKRLQEYRSVAVTGTIGILYSFAQLEIRQRNAFQRSILALRATNFYFDYALSRAIEELAFNLT